MHFAYPPRKNSNPPPFSPRSSRIFIPIVPRKRLKLVICLGFVFMLLLWLFSRRDRSTTSSTARRERQVITGKPLVVIVTVLDERISDSTHEKEIRANRVAYAEEHGYETHLPEVGDYDLGGAPASWSKVVATRHAMTLFPNCKYVWYLDQNSLIMNPNLRLETDVMDSTVLEGVMRKDLPVVPPDSIIKTFSHLKGEDVDFVLTQDKDGLSAGSFIIRNGEWAKFFLDTWFDPLYRTYNFQKAETHALEHIVQWHPTILSKLAIVPQRLINSYSRSKHGDEYEEGDNVIRFAGCTARAGERSCVDQVKQYSPKWREAFEKSAKT